MKAPSWGYGMGLAPATDDSAKQFYRKNNMNGTIIKTDAEFNEFFARIAVREAAFEAVWDGIVEETDISEISLYLTNVMTWHGNDEAFYNALISELYTGAIRSRKEGEPQPTRDLRWLPYVPFQP